MNTDLSEKNAVPEISIPPIVFDLLSDEYAEKLQQAVGMIRLVRDVASKRKTVMDALAEIGITSDTVVEKIQGVMTRAESGFLNALTSLILLRLKRYPCNHALQDELSKHEGRRITMRKSNQAQGDLISSREGAHAAI